MEEQQVSEIIWKSEDGKYLVSWKGMCLLQNTYELESSLPSELVEQFNQASPPTRGYRPREDDLPKNGELSKWGTCSWCVKSGFVGRRFGRDKIYKRNVVLKFKSNGFAAARRRMENHAKCDPRLHAEVMMCAACEKRFNKKKKKETVKPVDEPVEPKVPSPVKQKPVAPLLVAAIMLATATATKKSRKRKLSMDPVAAGKMSNQLKRFKDYPPPPPVQPNYTPFHPVELETPPGKSNQPGKKVYVCRWSDRHGRVTPDKPAHELNANVTVDLVELFEICCRNPTCGGCGAVGKKYPQYFSTGPGGVAEVQLGCRVCTSEKSVEVIRTGSKVRLLQKHTKQSQISTKKSSADTQRDRVNDCPFRNVEEARMVLRHFLSKGQGSQMAASTAFMGTAGISSERWADMEFYVFDCMKVAKSWSNSRVWNAAKRVKAGTLGHISRMWVALDARWHCRGKSSIHGTCSMANQAVSGLAHFGAVHMSKNVTEEEQRLLGLQKYTGTSPSMDPTGAEMLVKCVFHEGGEICRYCQDGDAKTKKRLAQLWEIGNTRRKEQKAKRIQDGISADGEEWSEWVTEVVRCVNHLLVNLSNKLIASQYDKVAREACKATCPRRLNKDGTPGPYTDCKRISVPRIRHRVILAVRTWLEEQDYTDVKGIRAMFEQAVHERMLAHIRGECSEHCKHPEDWKPGPNSLIDCGGDLELIEREINEKVGSHLDEIFVGGLPLETNNRVEAANAFYSRELPKGTAVSARTYAVRMMKAECEISSRYLWNLPACEGDVAGKDELIWKEVFYEQVAAKLGVHVSLIYSEMERRADREYVRRAAHRSLRRCSVEGQLKEQQYKKKQNQLKEERSGGADQDDYDFDKGKRQGAKLPSTMAGKAKVTGVKKCRCGSTSHQRTSHKSCKLNARRKENLETEMIEADIMVMNDSEIVVDSEEDEFEREDAEAAAEDKAAIRATRQPECEDAAGAGGNP
jgi:hypothetical protein